MDNLEHNDYVSNLTTLESADTSGVLMKCDTWQITANIKQESRAVAGNPRDAVVIFDP